MAKRFPKVRLRPSVFGAAARLDTAFGGTAAADLMLHPIDRAPGEEMTAEVADQIVHDAVRNLYRPDRAVRGRDCDGQRLHLDLAFLARVPGAPRYLARGARLS